MSNTNNQEQEKNEEEEKTRDDREFQLELLKFQTTHDLISSSALTYFLIEFSTFVSLTVTFLVVGVEGKNLWFMFLAVLTTIVLGVALPLTIRYFDSQELREKVERALDKELQPIRDRFIKKKENENQNKNP